MDTSLAAKSSYLEVSKFSGKPYASCFDITTGLWNPRHPTLVARMLHYSCSKFDANLAGIQDQSFDSFTHILECAAQFDMPQLLACCEYHIATDPHDRFQPVASRLQHVLPLSSFYRIAEGLSTGFEHMAASSLPSEQHCPCGYCGHAREGVCVCVPGSPSSSKDCARALRAKSLPGPKDFLQMAQR